MRSKKLAYVLIFSLCSMLLYGGAFAEVVEPTAIAELENAEITSYKTTEWSLEAVFNEGTIYLSAEASEKLVSVEATFDGKVLDDTLESITYQLKDGESVIESVTEDAPEGDFKSYAVDIDKDGTLPTEVYVDEMTAMDLEEKTSTEEKALFITNNMAELGIENTDLTDNIGAAESFELAIALTNEEWALLSNQEVVYTGSVDGEEVLSVAFTVAEMEVEEDPEVNIQLLSLAVDGEDILVEDQYVYDYELPEGAEGLVEASALEGALVQIEQKTEEVNFATVLVQMEGYIDSLYEIRFTNAEMAVEPILGITLDGEMLDGFDADVFDYELEFEEGALVPDIQAVLSGDEYSAEISLPESIPGLATVIVKDAELNELATYTLDLILEEVEEPIAESPVEENPVVEQPITPALSSNVYLKFVKIDGEDLPGFDSEDMTYKYPYELGATVECEPLDDLSSATIAVGDESIKITVTAENGDEGVYIIEREAVELEEMLLDELLPFASFGGMWLDAVDQPMILERGQSKLNFWLSSQYMYPELWIYEKNDGGYDLVKVVSTDELTMKLKRGKRNRTTDLNLVNGFYQYSLKGKGSTVFEPGKYYKLSIVQDGQPITFIMGEEASRILYVEDYKRLMEQQDKDSKEGTGKYSNSKNRNK